MMFHSHVLAFMKVFCPEFPREIAMPFRLTANSLEDFIQLSEEKHKRHNIFTNLYQIQKNEIIIDKLWIDFDGHNQYILKNEVMSAITKFKSLGILEKNILVVFTGKKGYHLYIRVKPMKMKTKQASEMLHYILSYVTEGLKNVDRPLFTDTRRITRVAGIQRPEKQWCFALKTSIFKKQDSINEYLSSFLYNYNSIMKAGEKNILSLVSSKFSISDISGKIKNKGYVPSALPTFKNEETVSTIPANYSENDLIEKGNDYTPFLRLLIDNDSLFHAIHTPNPIHIDRIRLARKLLSSGLEIPIIVDIMRSLNWFDFDPIITENHVRYIKQKYVKS
mgnify:FL=1